MPSPVAVDDAEKGTMEQLDHILIPAPLPLTASVAVQDKVVALERRPAIDEKKAADITATTFVQSSKPSVPPKTFKRASRWVRFQLWLNTYRYVDQIWHC